MTLLNDLDGVNLFMQRTVIMHNGQKLRHWIALLVCVVSLVCGPALAAASPKEARKDAKPQPQLVIIDELASAKKLEMPPAVFPHDKHVREVAKKDQGCALCHTQLTGNTAFSFKNLPGKLSPKQAEDKYHSGCISCHVEWNDGPQAAECRQCHVDTKATTQLSVPYDKSLHAVHVQSRDITFEGDAAKNCGACHHQWNEAEKRLVWVPGQEEACSVCHAQFAHGNTPSLQEASHRSCVTCHVETAKKWADADKAADAEKVTKPEPKKPEPKKNAVKADPVIGMKGPVTCAGCHSAEGQANFPRLAEVPRLMRGQPDVTVILPVNNADTATAGTSMDPVLFNHKAHEAATDSCNVCHHVRIADNGCVQCHTVQGTPESTGVSLYQAMHKADAQSSCVGCHQQTVLQNKECAGCHVLIKPTTQVVAQDSCGVCHAPVQGLPSVSDGSAAKLGKTALQDIATQNLAKRKAAVPLSPDQVPETVSIGALSDLYEPSVFPHRKVYKALLDGFAENSMASAFHATPEATCGACHHNVPAANLAQPPKCITCHENTAGAVAPGRPMPLKAAYHQQCMACHERMDVKPVATDCAGCHAVRTSKPAANAS